MIIKVIREGAKSNGAIPSKVYVDNVFFAYGLENDAYKIPFGDYELYLQYSPSFKSKKVYVKVPNRTNILFHGGNTVNDTKGCILVGANRGSGGTIEKDQSEQLYNVLEAAAKNGESVFLHVAKDRTALYALFCFLGLCFITLKR